MNLKALFPKSQPAVVALALLTLSLAGCGRGDGPEVAEVSGIITLDGDPLPWVNIQFVPESPGGSPSFGGTNLDGKYRLLFTQDKAGAMLGRHRVEISPRESRLNEDDEKLPSESPLEIPKKYLQPGALTADVESGSNVINFELSSQ